jgi:hydrophobic/amphiphilic exporter-1 (mainly G- bacteria), HAE1 family
MKRIAIIANHSVQAEVMDALEQRLGEFPYMLIPVISGRGRQGSKLGTVTWPEENFLLLVYTDDASASIIVSEVDAIKKLFTKEGVKCFVVTMD